MLILIVEDDERTASFLSRGLREEGHQVDVCESGRDALERGKTQPYDVILLDWMLPDLDGIAVLRRWREAGVTTPVIVLTAREGVDSTVLALDSGADDYVEKPFSFEELLARIRAQTRRAPHEGAEARSVDAGGASIDLKSRSVERGDETFALTDREFDLLDHFLQNRGEVISRSRILDRVWDVSHDTTTNSVDVYVRHLRSKLDPPDAGTETSVIETVRGRGYRLRKQAEME
ncbi:MAG: response regulator transcription factor [Bradymonadaceae bacterium]